MLNVENIMLFTYFYMSVCITETCNLAMINNRLQMIIVQLKHKILMKHINLLLDREG